MANFVSLAEAKMWLRIDDDANDAVVSFMIPAVSDAILRWLKDDWRAYEIELDSAGDPIIDSSGDPIPVIDDSTFEFVPKAIVKLAVVVEIASFFRFREGEGTDNVVPADAGYGYVLNKASTALLTPLRRPTVA